MHDMPRRVREPVQAYLESDDSRLLSDLSERLSIPKAEVIRLGIRRLAQELELAQRPGTGLSALVGALDSAAGVPSDLAARHDEYLYQQDARAPLRRVGDTAESGKTDDDGGRGVDATDAHRG